MKALRLEQSLARKRKEAPVAESEQAEDTAGDEGRGPGEAEQSGARSLPICLPSLKSCVYSRILSTLKNSCDFFSFSYTIKKKTPANVIIHCTILIYVEVSSQVPQVEANLPEMLRTMPGRRLRSSAHGRNMKVERPAKHPSMKVRRPWPEDSRHSWEQSPRELETS